MLDIKQRASAAQQLWQQAIEAEARAQYERAYLLHTQAHDLVMDCAKLHQSAHRHLKRVNKALGNTAELATDSVLLFLAPVGIFELVSYFSKADAFGAKICRRKAE